MAFIRRSGISPLLSALRRHTEAGKALRVLTTTYTGSTEGRALDQLADLGADVRISYDLGSTRLHAKRSEEHTSELQSLMRISYAVFCLKKKTTNTQILRNK